MKKEELDRLNDAAMEIIMHAGDARKMLTDALNLLMEDNEEKMITKLLDDAKHELAKAHNIQTEIIQETIADADQITCLLFTHAQDTLMTINSEMLQTKQMVKMYRRLKREVQNV